ncbi:hypothetical protein ACLESO_23710 [Pyxidicoccus sp. 3LG]
MTRIASRRVLCAFLVVMASACGAPEMGTEAPEPETSGPSPERVAEEMAGYNWQGQEEDANSSVEAQWCALEYMQPCIGYKAVCAVRCCDDALFKSVQYCGDCGEWASKACANHGTRKRVRWEKP